MEYKLKFELVTKRLDILAKLTSSIPEFYEQVEGSLNNLWD